MAEKPQVKQAGFVNPFTDTFEAAMGFAFLDKKKKLNIVLNVSRAFALVLMIFIRRKVGYRLLKPSRLILMGLLIVFLPSALSFIPTIKGDVSKTPVIAFVVVMLVLGILQRRQRWNELKSGVLWHSQSEGISRFDFLPLNESICNRFIDPMVCSLIGLAVMFSLSAYLGAYLIFSALMLFHFEQALHEYRIENLLDQLDGYCEAEANQKLLELHSTQADAQAQTISREQTAGIATGLAPDIEAQINRRRNRQENG
jgi:hypothetical protein